MTGESSFWADQIADEAIAKHKKNLVCTGITPSGHIHIGNMREVLSGDAVYRAILDRGGKAEFLYIGDTYDALRKVYPFLDPAVYAKFVGHPISDIPGPAGDGATYAEHFLKPFLAALQELGLDVKVELADRMYKTGRYTDAIFTALEKRDAIAAILHEETGKEIQDDWSPANPRCEACGKITEAVVTGYSRERHSVSYTCGCGHKSEADADTGGVKLTWRVDWPARWSILGVTVEPFGKDHASSGGSYDTGKRISAEVFGWEAPIPIVYEWISLKGQGDMSSSKGNVISIADMLEVVPPDVLRYLIFRTRPKKSIVFDPGLPMLNLVDELDDAENKNRDTRAYELSLVSGMKTVGIPFKHLVNIFQIARGDAATTLEIIRRSGYQVTDEQALFHRMEYARTWLARHAPEEMKFTPLEEIPAAASSFTPATKKALAFFADELDPAMSGDAVHELFYRVKEACGIDLQEFFRAVYLLLIGKERGPRAGWFIQILGIATVRERFRKAAAL